MILKNIYAVFIGLMLAILVGVGIDAFYLKPKAPEFRNETVISKFEATPSAEQLERERIAQEEYQNEYNKYRDVLGKYNMNVSMMSLAFSVVFLAVSLIGLKKLDILSDGLLIGGLLTQLYSVFLGFEAQNSRYRFLVVLCGLTVAIIIGYMKFVRPEKRKK